jgi:stage IV sporulation protein B
MDARRLAGTAGIAVLVALYASPSWRALGYLPAKVVVASGDDVRLGPNLPTALRARGEGGAAAALDLDGTRLGRAWRRLGRSGLEVRAVAPGRYVLDLGVLGVRVRRLEVDAAPATRLVPGGQSIAIRVRTAGVLVVGRSARGGVPVLWPWPLLPAGGLDPGDRIVAVDGRPLMGEAALRGAVARAGRARRALRLTVVRDGAVRALKLVPRRDRGGGYRLGVAVRDGLTGIGTLTLYDPASGVYAALGHRIQDGWVGQSVPVVGGRIEPATILGVRRGLVGRPGEKIGSARADASWGSVDGSGAYGIFGRLRAGVARARALPLATEDEVHAGDAELWTVVRGERVERFRIRIERADPAAPGGRGLVVRVVDPRLLRRTGGIVQGMSGSPIVEDGRLAGALTHVLVSDATRGYGVYAQWIWHEARHSVSCVANGIRSDRRTSTIGSG